MEGNSKAGDENEASYYHIGGLPPVLSGVVLASERAGMFLWGLLAEQQRE